jgi:hypothetical protein
MADMVGNSWHQRVCGNRRRGDEDMRADTEARPGRSSWLGALPLSPPPASRWLSAGLLVVGAAVTAAWVLLAAVHVDDRYELDHVAGARMALARYLNDGILYPPLYDGTAYGGTRFMPLPIVLHAALARITGEYLVSGKVLACGTMLTLLGVTFVLLRRLRCPLPIAVGLLAAVLTTGTGLVAGLGLRADSLPLLLQLLAVAAVAGSRRPAAAVAAAALAALAFSAKLSAVWAPLAICVWLAAVDRRRLVWFLAAYGALVAGLLAVLGALSDGRIFENVFGLSTAGVTGPGSLLRGPSALLRLLVEQATAAWALLPVAAAAAWLAIRQRQVSIYVISLACCLIVLLMVLADVGTGWNQLIDLVVLTVLVVGEFAGRSRPEPLAAAVPAVLAVILLWVNLSGLVVTVGPEVREAVTMLRGTRLYDPQPLSGQATPATSLLSEDPYVPVSLGQRPVVLDPFMLRRLEDRDPAAVQRLVERIRAREFELVVLVVPLRPSDQAWWRDMHFGTHVTRALADAYTEGGRVQGYYLYRPAPDGPFGGTG